MVANLLCNRGTVELPCELLQTAWLGGKDMKYCLDFQNFVRIF